jgi:hypothetical protein
VDAVGVGAGAAPRRLRGALDALGGRDLVEQVVHGTVHDRPARDHGPGAQAVLAHLAGVHAGSVGGVRHVHHHGEVGLEPIRHDAGAVRSDLLLHRRHAGDGPGATARLLHPPRHLERHVRAQPVVEGP